MRKMKKILLAVISLLPVLTYGQSMKIDPKQLMPGANGNVIITRNGVNTLDNIDWSDINNIPSDLERTSNKVTSNQNYKNVTDDVKYPSTKAVANNFMSIIAPNISNAHSIFSQYFTGDLDTINNYSAFTINSNTQNGPGSVFGSGVVWVGGFGNADNSVKYSSRMALSYTANDQFYYWNINNNIRGNFYQVASRQWVNSQGFLTSETDPVYTADMNNLVRKYTTNDVFSALPNSANYQGSVLESTINATNLPPDGSNSFTGINLMPNHNPNFRTILGVSSNGSLFTAQNNGGTWVYRSILRKDNNISLLANDAGYITSASIPAAQTLSITGQNLSLSGGGGTVTIPNTTYTAGTGLSLTGTTFTNTAPDQVVSLTSGTGISVAGTYPNFTVTNTAPNVPYTLPMASASVLGGIKIGSRLSIASGVLSADNMIQNLSLSGQTLSISGGNNVTIPATDITTALNANTGILTTESSTGNDDSIQLLTRTGGYGYLEPVGLEGINTTGGFAAMAQTVAFNSTYIEINSNTYTYYIVAGGNPSGGNIKLTDPAGWHGRIIRIINTSGAIGTFINFSIRGISSSSVTSIPIGGYIVIQSIEDGSGTWVWAQIGGNY